MLKTNKTKKDTQRSAYHTILLIRADKKFFKAREIRIVISFGSCYGARGGGCFSSVNNALYFYRRDGHKPFTTFCKFSTYILNTCTFYICKTSINR